MKNYAIKGPNAWQQILVGGFKTKEDAIGFMKTNADYYDKEHIKKHFGGDEKRWFDFMIYEYEVEFAD